VDSCRWGMKLRIAGPNGRDGVRRRPYCLRRRVRLPSLSLSSQERGMVRRATQPSPYRDGLLSKAAASLDAPPGHACAVRAHFAASSLRRRAALRRTVPSPNHPRSASSWQRPIVATGGAPPSPECRLARPARGRRTGHGEELPLHAQEGDAAHLRGTPSFVPLSRRLMKAPLSGRGVWTIILLGIMSRGGIRASKSGRAQRFARSP
jgi:hypothetical protein